MATEQKDDLSLIAPSACINPNLSAGTQHIQLSPIYLVPWSTLPSALVFDHELDQSRLEGAIAELAGWYPVLAGRYVTRPRPGPDLSEYAIELTSSAIPLYSASLQLESPHPFPSTHVIQSSLSPFVPTLSSDVSSADSDAALAAFKHTLLLHSRRSVLGVAISHTLADAASCSKMLHDLAHLYTHPGASLPDPPHFLAKITYPEWPPSEPTRARFRTNLLVPTETSRLYDSYVAAADVSEPVTFTLTPQEVMAIRRQVQDGCELTISDQDAISGWWIDFIERLGEERVQTVTYMFNYRNLHPNHPAFPTELKNQYSTVAQVRDINVNPASHPAITSRSIGVATAIRAEIETLKNDPDYTLTWLANAAYWHETVAREGKGFDYIPRPGVAIIKSNMRYDWTPSFGGSASRYHTAFSTRRFLRVFRQNAGDASATAKEASGVELAFRVEKGGSEKAYALLADDRGRWATIRRTAGQ